MEGVETRNNLYGFEFREPDKRRVDLAERKTYDIKGLWQRNHEIINLVAKGYKQVEVAEILNVHPQTVSNTVNSELGQKKLSELRRGSDEEVKKVTEKVRVISDKCLATYNELFDNESDELTLKDKGNFAQGFLSEFSGLKSPTKIQSHSIHTTLTKAELEEFKKRGVEAARESGMIIDVEAEEVK